MKLRLENVGKIVDSEIILDGITVITGDNNTGKSTVGKALYLMFSSMRNIKEETRIQKKRKIKDILKDYIDSQFMADYELYPEECDNYDIPDAMTDDLMDSYTKAEDKISYLTELFKKYLSNELPELFIRTHKILSGELVEDLDQLICRNDKEYYQRRVSAFLNYIFKKDLINIDADHARISTEIKNKTNTIYINDDSSKNDIIMQMGIKNKAILINNVNGFRSAEIMENGKYKAFVSIDELMNMNTADITSYISDTILSDKTREFYETLNKAVEGKFVSEQYEKTGFKFEGAKKSIDIQNLSDGVRSILLLRLLCEKGVLQKKDVLILDEPEIHMHPDWQLIYAEAIIELQEIFELTLVITSHSAVFVRAIESYCDLKRKMDILNIYQTVRADADNPFAYNIVNMSNTEYGISEIYEKFTYPFEVLDNLDYEYTDENDADLNSSEEE